MIKVNHADVAGEKLRARIYGLTTRRATTCADGYFSLSFNQLQISWTHALRQIVINCYKFHGREDLLPAFSEDDDKSNVLLQQGNPHSSSHQSSSNQGQGGQSQQQQTVGVVRINSTDSSKGNSSPAQIIAASPTALATATQVGVDRDSL